MSSNLQLSNRAFWDIDFASLDFDKDKNFIVRKAFDRGSWNDMKWCVDYYGEEAVKEILVNAPYLRDEVVRLCSVIFKIQSENFRCSIRKQQMPIPGGY
jgi:hypothetical protein